MPPNGWLVSIETIREAVETDVFKQPGKVAKLPNALGGDPKRSDELRDLIQGSALAVNKNAFFESPVEGPLPHAPEANRDVHEVQQQGVRLEGTPERAGATANCKRLHRSGGKGEHRGDDAHPGGQ